MASLPSSRCFTDSWCPCHDWWMHTVVFSRHACTTAHRDCQMGTMLAAMTVWEDEGVMQHTSRSMHDCAISCTAAMARAAERRLTSSCRRRSCRQAATARSSAGPGVTWPDGGGGGGSGTHSHLLTCQTAENVRSAARIHIRTAWRLTSACALRLQNVSCYPLYPLSGYSGVIKE
jgi:hypothetical protein